MTRGRVRHRLCTSQSQQGSAWVQARAHRDERYAVADHIVCQLTERGDPWHLGDEAKRGDAPTI